MARWQKPARIGVGLFAIGFAAVLWFVTGERRAPAPVPGVDRLDPKAVSEIKGGDVVQIKGEKRDVRVEFATQVLYSDGASKYTGFKAFVDDRGGRSFEVSGNEALVAPELSAYDVRGDVTLQTSDGLTAKTSQATFAEADGILRGASPMTFQRARVSGSGVGFSYDRALDRLELRDKAVINVAPAGDGTGAMAVTSGSASHSRLERYMRFEGGMRMERQGQVMEAANATVFLLKDRDEPEHVELRGNSKITGAAGTGSLQAMQANDINLNYAADGRTLEHALLVGQGGIQLARPDGSPGQQLVGDTIDVRLAPDGAVTGLHGRDNVRVTLPATADASARTVTAPLLTASGQAGRGITSMTFENGVTFVEDAFKGANTRTARARTLTTAMGEGDVIEAANFSGDFRFEDGRLSAESAEAVYNVTKGALALRGPETAARRPHMQDERFVIDATTIDVTLSPRRLVAKGRVSAQLSPGRREGEQGTTLFSDKEALLVAAENFVFDEATGEGAYTGRATLLQQESGSSIRAESIALNQKTGILKATGNVVTSLPLAARPEEGAKGNSIARGDEFNFDDQKRRAVFAKTAQQQAQLDGAQGNLRANRIELILAEKGNELQQLLADGAVIIAVDKREARGQKLVYEPDGEKYVLNGTPVSLVDGCQESTGRSLTFYRGSDKISIDGQETRAQTKGGKCPEPPRD